jgi:hypothetical protein
VRAKPRCQPWLLSKLIVPARLGQPAVVRTVDRPDRQVTRACRETGTPLARLAPQARRVRANAVPRRAADTSAPHGHWRRRLPIRCRRTSTRDVSHAADGRSTRQPITGRRVTDAGQRPLTAAGRRGSLLGCPGRAPISENLYRKVSLRTTCFDGSRARACLAAHPSAWIHFLRTPSAEHIVAEGLLGEAQGGTRGTEG